MLSIIALIVFVIGVLLVYMKDSKYTELGRACLWVGLAVLVWNAAGWHAVSLR